MLGFTILNFGNLRSLYLDGRLLFSVWDSDDANFSKISGFIDGYCFAMVFSEHDRIVKQIDLYNNENFDDIGEGITLPFKYLNEYSNINFG